MKSIKVMSTTALFLFIGIAAPVNARQEKPKEESKPAKQEQPAKPEKQQSQSPKQQPQHQQQAQAPKQEQPQHQKQAQAPKQQPQHQQQAGRQQQQQNSSPKQQRNANGQQQQARHQQGGNAHPPERTQQARETQRSQPALRLSVRGSGRIPDERFRSDFGREHNFRMGNPVLVGGYSRFQYGGFWFGFVQPWPADWYYTDDVYIDYVDGDYYMYNPYYPGTRFSISVVI